MQRKRSFAEVEYDADRLIREFNHARERYARALRQADEHDRSGGSPDSEARQGGSQAEGASAAQGRAKAAEEMNRIQELGQALGGLAREILDYRQREKATMAEMASRQGQLRADASGEQAAFRSGQQGIAELIRRYDQVFEKVRSAALVSDRLLGTGPFAKDLAGTRVPDAAKAQREPCFRRSSM